MFQSYLDSFVIVFIDDILIYSKIEGEHMNKLRMVLQVLKENRLFSNYSMCEFLLRSVCFLVISSLVNELNLIQGKLRRSRIRLDH